MPATPLHSVAENLAEKDCRRVSKRAEDCRSLKRESLEKRGKTGVFEESSSSQLSYGDLSQLVTIQELTTLITQLLHQNSIGFLGARQASHLSR
jgi:hypothetical protein